LEKRGKKVWQKKKGVYICSRFGAICEDAGSEVQISPDRKNAFSESDWFYTHNESGRNQEFFM